MVTVFLEMPIVTIWSVFPNPVTYNIAVSANIVLTAIYTFKSLPPTIKSNLSEEYENEVSQLNLTGDQVKLEKDGAVYKSVASGKLARLKSSIWFVPTSHGWYWTPTDPHSDKEINWMSVLNSKVISGNFKLKEAHISIINWFRENSSKDKQD